MSPFQQQGLEFSLRSLRDFENLEFVERLLDILLNAPSFLRPQRYDRFEPAALTIGENSKSDMMGILLNNFDVPTRRKREGLLLLDFAPNGGYMVDWSKGERLFQLVSGNAPRRMLEEHRGSLDDFIGLFYRLAEHIVPEYGSMNSMMTVGLEIPYDLTKRLPNVPWLILFGKPYVEMFGREKILRAPFVKIDELSCGLIAGRLTSTPFEPLSEEVRAPIREYFGPDCFMEGTKSLKLYSGGKAPQFDFGQVS